MNSSSSRISWKILSIGLMGLIGAIAIAGLFGNIFAPASATRPVPTINVVQRMGNQASLSDVGQASSDATCQAGESLAGGGYTSASTLNVIASYKLSGSTWEVLAYSQGGTGSFVAYAECATIAQ